MSVTNIRGQIARRIGSTNARRIVKRPLVLRTVVAGTALLVAIAVSPCPARATSETFQRTYAFARGGTFQLQNVNGSVQVEGWARNEVQVRAVKTSAAAQSELDRVRIDVQSRPGTIAVRTLYPSSEGAEIAVEYHIYVPYRILLGSVQTVNGSVRVRGIEGRGELRSVNGNVEVLDSAGRFSARTTNGNLRLELRKLLDGAPMDIETVNGSVVLGLPANARADLRILSMNGDFHSDLPVSASARLPLRGLRVKLGAGGGEISLRTINGGIRLVREHPGI